MVIGRLIISLLLTFLPVSVLIRDWKFHDKRTKKHHKVTRAIVVFWFVGSIGATCFVWHDSSQIEELIEGKDQLLEKVNKYQNDLSEKGKKIQELQKMVDVINSLEIFVFLDEITPSKPITKKETSVGIQNAVGLFSKDKTRFRFVTDFQFSFQQISANIRRAMFAYKPEEPSQILGRNIDFLQQMEKFAFNYVGFIEPVGFDRNNQTHKISIKLLLNGIEVISLAEIPIEQGSLYSGQLVLNVNESFKNISEIYKRQINIKSN